MLKGNAGRTYALHFLNYILSYILHIVTITYIVICFIYIDYIHCYPTYNVTYKAS